MKLLLQAIATVSIFLCACPAAFCQLNDSGATILSKHPTLSTYEELRTSKKKRLSSGITCAYWDEESAQYCQQLAVFHYEHSWIPVTSIRYRKLEYLLNDVGNGIVDITIMSNDSASAYVANGFTALASLTSITGIASARPPPRAVAADGKAGNLDAKASVESYWGLSGSRIFLAYHRRLSPRGRAPDTLPLGAYVTTPVLVTGNSESAVMSQLPQRYKAAGGQLVWVNSAGLLRQSWGGPADMDFGVLPKSCGSGFAASLLDGGTKSPATVGHAGMGFGRIVSLGCGQNFNAAMLDAISDCRAQGGCTMAYVSTIAVRIEVAQWDGSKTGAIAGGGGTADLPSIYSGVGGCGFEISDRSSNVGAINSGGVVTTAACKVLASSFR